MTLTCGFIGLGLIGGSIARAIRKYDPDAILKAYNPSRASLDEALSDGVINAGTQSIDSTFSDCRYIFLCGPVSCNDENIAAVKQVMAPDCILTDIGSVKTDIHESIAAAGLQSHFIGGHPMAGSERTKYRNSKAELLENAWYILAPEPEVPAAEVESFRRLIESIGAQPLVLNNGLHDYAVAAVSHVPHVISASLVNLVKECDTPDGIMKLIAAGGFRDITRISSSSPVMWQQICLTNQENILKVLDRYIADLQNDRALIADGDADALYALFDSARQYRDSFAEDRRGPLPRVFMLHVNIADRPGVLAEAVSLLASDGISIKNIGISHNREYEEGVLRIELHSREETDRAAALLKDRGFSVL